MPEKKVMPPYLTGADKVVTLTKEAQPIISEITKLKYRVSSFYNMAFLQIIHARLGKLIEEKKNHTNLGI